MGLTHLSDFRGTGEDTVLCAVEEMVRRLDALKIKHSKAVQMAFAAVGIEISENDITDVEVQTLLPLRKGRSVPLEK